MKLVCRADTRLKVVVVALVGIPRIAVDAGEEEAAFQIEARNPERTGARAVETDSELIAMLRRRRLEIPAQADVDREARGRFPVVLNERRIIEILPLTGGVDVDAASRGISEQERRERIAGRGIANRKSAGGPSASRDRFECEQCRRQFLNWQRKCDDGSEHPGDAKSDD